jgi:hypothetical protein
VDLFGADFAAVAKAAQPMIDWLVAREPGVVVRSISVNDARILVSLEASPKPRAIRIEEPSLREAALPAERVIDDLAHQALKRRA